MNFDNNHFIDAGNNISGYLYGLKRHYDTRFDGKGSKQPSTYSEEVYGYGWSSANQHPSTQRSNGLHQGVTESGHGILYGGLDWVYNPINGSYKAVDPDFEGSYIFLWQGAKDWGVQLFTNAFPSGHGQIKEPTLGKALKTGLWILTGKVRPEPLV